MGFEQLAELRDRLRAEKGQVETDSAKPRKQKSAQQTKPREQDPAVEAIWRLQKHFPLAFPVNPAPKVPLKEGILKDAEQHLELLGISSEQLKMAIATWCRGTRYWASMTENAPRLDLDGQPAGMVTASQALHAKRQQGQARRLQSKQKKRSQPPATDSTSEQVTE